jgi:uncharacterized membrane protein
MNKLRGPLPLILLTAVVICLGFIAYFAWLPNPADYFSEFYILNENGRSFDYPQSAAAGRPMTVTLGVVNHEAAAATYTIRIISGGAIIKSVDTGTIRQGGKWESKVDFSLNTPGAGQQVEFNLFMNDYSAPRNVKPLLLRIDVSKP